MLVFVDGPDGTGKTGYATWLADKLDVPFLRLEPDSDFGELDGDVIERVSSTFNHTLMQLDQQGIDAVIDRGPVSSIVYSRLFGRGEPDHAYETLDEVSCLVVYLRCEPHELEVRYDDEKFDNVAAIASTYDEVMNELDRTVITVDTSSGAPTQLRREVIDRVC